MQKEAKPVGLTKQLSWLVQTKSKHQESELWRDFVGFYSMVTLILFLDCVDLYTKEGGHKLYLTSCFLLETGKNNTKC